MSYKRKKIAYIKRNSKNNRNFITNFLIKLRDVSVFYDQDGYFLASLYKRHDVKEYEYKKYLEDIEFINKNFDAVVVNYKFLTGNGDKKKNLKLIHIANITKIYKILFVCNDKAFVLPEENIIDRFDLIFKREALSDLSLYRIGSKNMNKIKTTMLPCSLRYEARNILGLILLLFLNKKGGKSNNPNEYKNDVFFAGSLPAGNDIRLNVWTEIKKNKSLKLKGGLIPKKNITLNKDLLLKKKISIRKYIKIVDGTKINLALDGIGEFTFRHLELLHLGAFMISSPSIRNVNLPINIKEGVHYICYENQKDLINKIKFYLKNDKERNLIAKQGHNFFVNNYSTDEHSNYISNNIDNLFSK